MKILIIGAGNMGGAIAHGVRRAGMEAIVCDTDEGKIASLGFPSTDDPVGAAAESDVVIFAVKPSGFKTLLPCFKGITCPIYVSVAAGITVQYMKKLLGDVRVVRTMPNTPALIGEGMTALAGDVKDLELIVPIFKSLGQTAVVSEEKMDAVVAMNGSSPAYFYMMLDAMMQFGEQNGLNYETSKILAAQSMLGAAKMVLESDETPRMLCDRVCSPGGTTIRAVESLEAADMPNILKTAMAKCMERSKEMTKDI